MSTERSDRAKKAAEEIASYLNGLLTADDFVTDEIAAILRKHFPSDDLLEAAKAIRREIGL